MATGRDEQRTGAPMGPEDERVERLLGELRQAELPPFYRERLLARLRGDAAGRTRAGLLRSPRLAWAVAAVAVAALAVVLARGGRQAPIAVPVAPQAEQVAVESEVVAPRIDPMLPQGNAVVGGGQVEIVAAITPPLEGAVIRLLVDEEDVTGLAEVTADYVMYTPGERFAEGEHVITIEIRDRAGNKIRDITWLFYTVDGHRAPDERV